ncbi:MAG: hypothetical protein OXB96_02875 [Candidatus Kaiserbacteria bacterium]|nr:hypothetical protein [Candidatus Kaiserbacteria bacterium]
MYVRKNIGEIVKVSTVPALIASLCCFSPILLVSLGVISVSVAGDLAHMLYGELKWLFRLAGFIALVVFLVSYLRRKKGICTLNDVKKRRNEIINIAALVLIAGAVLYVIFLYGVAEVIGKALGIW